MDSEVAVFSKTGGKVNSVCVVKMPVSDKEIVTEVAVFSRTGGTASVCVVLFMMFDKVTATLLTV